MRHPALNQILVFKLSKGTKEKYALSMDTRNFTSLDELHQEQRKARKCLAEKYPDWQLAEIIFAKDKQNAGIAMLNVPEWQDIKLDL